MPKKISGLDENWTLKQVTEFYDSAKFAFNELCNLYDEIEAEQGFMSWEEKTSDYGEMLEEVKELIGGCCGLGEDFQNELKELVDYLTPKKAKA